MPKTLENLTLEDFIVFIDEPSKELIVTQPTQIYRDGSILVHYLYSGHHSTSQILRPEEVLGIGDLKSGTTEIPGWKGKYDILQPEKLKEHLEKK
ncbi:hypothetical protein KA107_00500 [Candidatus Pacearchaeota archaeon]|nr:hypothetical protein [Candidatus Pacearchaeota archaeon]